MTGQAVVGEPGGTAVEWAVTGPVCDGGIGEGSGMRKRAMAGLKGVDWQGAAVSLGMAGA